MLPEPWVLSLGSQPNRRRTTPPDHNDERSSRAGDKAAELRARRFSHASFLVQRPAPLWINPLIESHTNRIHLTKRAIEMRFEIAMRP